MEDVQLVKPVPTSDFMAMVGSASRDPSVDPVKLQQLLEMAERMMKFQAERDFSNAMRLCQEEISPIAKTAENSHTGTTYAKLEAIDRAIRPVYTSHGFVMSFGSAPPRGEHSVRVTCDVRHSSGHTQQYELEGELDTAGLKGGATKTGIQGLGSTVTHLKRYLTMMIWNLNLGEPDRKFVTPEQALQIERAIRDAGITGDRIGKFLEWAKAGQGEYNNPGVGGILAIRFNAVMKMLQKAQKSDKIHPGGPSPA